MGLVVACSDDCTTLSIAVRAHLQEILLAPDPQMQRVTKDIQHADLNFYCADYGFTPGEICIMRGWMLCY